MLEEEFILGLKILAKVRSGKITTTCYNCTDDMKKALSCSGISPHPIAMDDDLGEFYTCPIQFISEQVSQWYDEYSYYQLFTGTAPNYGEVNVRFWEAVKIYKNVYDAESTKKSPNQSSNDLNNKHSLSKLRSGFKKRK